MNLSATRARQIGVASQIAGALTLAALLVRHAHWGWPAALATGLGASLAVFTAAIALAFVASYRGFGLTAALRPALSADAGTAFASAPALGPRAALACFAHEWVAVFRTFNWLQPFRAQRRFVPAATGAPGAAPLPPLLLVHGYGCNHAIWLDMQPSLAAAGYRCFGIDLEPIFGDIDALGAQLLSRMRELRNETGMAPLLLCHSMGGLVARAALAGARRVGESDACAGIVTLGTPHHGCALARFGAGIDARQMRCGNAWLETMSQGETARDRAAIVSIFSWHDSISGPPGSAWVQDAHNVPLSGIGHLSLLQAPAAVEATLQALQRLRMRQEPIPKTGSPEHPTTDRLGAAGLAR